ncbi:MAG: dihydroorotate dehydrogenase-like protein, partial [Bacteroidales bacterium]|nr:dihydroorotate dehydrogenase-like protein [Bacteroidales bacterium]
LSTKYLGFKLKNPFIASSSGLTDSVDKAYLLEQSGAAAIVVKSLFEEQIMMDVDAQRMNNIFNSYSEAEDYIAFYTRKHALSNYIELIDGMKQKLNIPVIASINCSSADSWIDFAGDIQAAGADAIELNMFIMPSDVKMKGEEIEKRYIDVARKVSQSLSIPVAMKIHHYFSGMANFAVELSQTGIKALVLFNRFYQPDVDLENMKIVSGNVLSQSDENAEVRRWLSILSGKVNCDLAASTGIHNAEAAIKNLLLGANAIQLASVLYQKGPSTISTMVSELNSWLDKKGINSVSEIIGKLRQSDSLKPMAYERAQFMKYFSDAR